MNPEPNKFKMFWFVLGLFGCLKICWVFLTLLIHNQTRLTWVVDVRTLTQKKKSGKFDKNWDIWRGLRERECALHANGALQWAQLFSGWPCISHCQLSVAAGNLGMSSGFGLKGCRLMTTLGTDPTTVPFTENQKSLTHSRVQLVNSNTIGLTRR